MHNTVGPFVYTYLRRHVEVVCSVTGQVCRVCITGAALQKRAPRCIASSAAVIPGDAFRQWG
jgi:hypothetical protein